jgi:hypothetical protein
VSVYLSALIAAVVGALVTAYATWWVSGRLNRQREARELRSALRVVATELAENSDRLRGADDDLQAARSELLLGDWLGSKVGFAGLWARDKELWRDVARMYSQISDFIGGRQDRKPDADEMERLARGLEDAEEEVGRDAKKFSLRP